MPEPRPRTPAQLEASRRNGARSRGPVTPEGKAQASRNALQHGLTAMHHLVLEDEAPQELADMTARFTAEVAPQSELEARLARRLAVAFWKGERAERLEVALFAAAPKLRPPQAGFAWQEADPRTTFDVKRFNAVRGYQAQQGREISRCLKELRLLRQDPLAHGTGEPEERSENEPGRPPAPANDDARPHRPPACATAGGALRNEPGLDPWDALPAPVRAELDRLLAADDWPGLAALGATGARWGWSRPTSPRPRPSAAPSTATPGRRIRPPEAARRAAVAARAGYSSVMPRDWISGTHTARSASIRRAMSAGPPCRGSRPIACRRAVTAGVRGR